MIFLVLCCTAVLPSVLWRCWLGGRKGIRPVKIFEWCSTGMVICLERDADLHMAQLMPLPLSVSCFSKIQIGFTFLVLAHPGSPGKRAVKLVCVCVLYCSTKFCWMQLSYIYFVLFVVFELLTLIRISTTVSTTTTTTFNCRLGIWKSIQSVKIEWWGVGVVICLERGADCLHMVQLMPLPSPHPIISCFI